MSIILRCKELGKGSTTKAIYVCLRSLLERITNENVTVSGHCDDVLTELFEKLLFEIGPDLDETAGLNRSKVLEAAAKISWPGIKDIFRARLPLEIKQERSAAIRNSLEQLLPSD